MPSKKKKYNARFPPARIKKIMQTDEDVGKVAAAVPVIISRALELFIESLILKASSATRARNAKTLSTAHIKQIIQSERKFDFLKDLVANIPDVQQNEEDSHPDHPEPGPRPRGRPRKRKPEASTEPRRRKTQKESSEDDSETEDADTDVEDEEEDEEEEKSSPAASNAGSLSRVGQSSKESPSPTGHTSGMVPSSSQAAPYGFPPHMGYPHPSLATCPHPGSNNSPPENDKNYNWPPPYGFAMPPMYPGMYPYPYHMPWPPPYMDHSFRDRLSPVPRNWSGATEDSGSGSTGKASSCSSCVKSTLAGPSEASQTPSPVPDGQFPVTNTPPRPTACIPPPQPMDSWSTSNSIPPMPYPLPPVAGHPNWRPPVPMSFHGMFPPQQQSAGTDDDYDS